MRVSGIKNSSRTIFDPFFYDVYSWFQALSVAHPRFIPRFKKFKEDYRKVQITPVIPDYADAQQNIKQALDFIRNNNESKTRGEFYQNGREHLLLLAENVDKLNSNRDELNKAIRKERTTFLFQALGSIAAIVTIATFVIVYF